MLALSQPQLLEGLEALLKSEIISTELLCVKAFATCAHSILDSIEVSAVLQTWLTVVTQRLHTRWRSNPMLWRTE